jgi:NADPH-dependent curcumin reductase CurA
MAIVNHQWRLASRPEGNIKESDFSWREEPVGDLADGQILVRNIYLSLDPTNRVWMAMNSYMPAVNIGDVMRGITIGVVEQSHNPNFREGDFVQGLGGWQLYSVSDGAGLAKLIRLPGVPLIAWFGAMGHIGFTAYFGIIDVAQVKAGETVVVTGAAGAVGSIAGQIAKIQGARVVGIAGSTEKCDWITNDLGFDAAINYRQESVHRALKTHCPDGVDVDFENVGGEILEAIINNMKLFGRIAVCGLISGYNSAQPSGPANFGLVIAKRLRIQGFLAPDFGARFPEAMRRIVEWLAEGKLQYRIDMAEGLRTAPASIGKLFAGTNTGKLVVRVSEEPAANA